MQPSLLGCRFFSWKENLSSLEHRERSKAKPPRHTQTNRDTPVESNCWHFGQRDFFCFCFPPPLESSITSIGASNKLWFCTHEFVNVVVVVILWDCHSNPSFQITVLECFLCPTIAPSRSSIGGGCETVQQPNEEERVVDFDGNAPSEPLEKESIVRKQQRWRQQWQWCY